MADPAKKKVTRAKRVKKSTPISEAKEELQKSPEESLLEDNSEVEEKSVEAAPAEAPVEDGGSGVVVESDAAEASNSEEPSEEETKEEETKEEETKEEETKEETQKDFGSVVGTNAIDGVVVGDSIAASFDLEDTDEVWRLQREYPEYWELSESSLAAVGEKRGVTLMDPFTVASLVISLIRLAMSCYQRQSLRRLVKRTNGEDSYARSRVIKGLIGHMPDSIPSHLQQDLATSLTQVAAKTPDETWRKASGRLPNHK